MNFNFFKPYINNYLEQKKIDNLQIYLSDLNGYLIYSNRDQINNSTIALVAGVYQGAKKLHQISGKKDSSSPSLSLVADQSSLYIKAVEVEGKELLLSALIENVKFPARYKMYLDILVQQIVRDYEPSVEVDQEKSTEQEKEKQQGEATKESFLFDDISDQEVDKLFSGI